MWTGYRKILFILAFLIPTFSFAQTQIGGGGTSSGSPGIPSSNGNVFYASNYSLPTSPATIVVCDATYNSTTTVTTPATDPPFTVGATYPVVWGYSNVQCGGNGQTFPMTQMVPTSATATATGAHTLILSSAALGNCTAGGQGNCSLVAGPSAATAVNAAYQAAVAAGPASTLVLPDAPFILDSNVTGGTVPCTNTGGGNDTPCFLTIKGGGPHTLMALGPAVTFATPLFFPTNATTNGTMFITYRDFSMTSMSPEIAGQNNQILLELQFGWEMQHVIMTNVYPQNTTSFSCVLMGGVLNSILSFHDNQLLNACGTALSVNGSDINIFNNWIQGSNRCIGAQNTTRIKSWGNRVTLCGVNEALVFAAGANDWESTGDAFVGTGTTLAAVNVGSASSVFKAHNTTIIAGQTSGPALTVAASTTAYIGGEQSVINATQGTSVAINNAGTLFIDHTNATQGGASGVSLSNSGTVTVGPGNNFSSGVTNTGTIVGQDGNGVYQGACTGVVTSATTVGLYTLGENSATTCTVATVGLGRVASKAGTVYALYCTATAGNQAADACTVTKNGAAQTMTCSLNGVATCSDGATGHQVAFVAGDIIGIEAVAGTGTTLAAVKGIVVTN